MKAQILKIAGVKSEKEFYKKYPSEAAFMKVHGKAFKKAKTGTAISKAQNFGNLDANNNGILDAVENPGGFNSSAVGQTANYADSGSNNAFPRPPLPTDIESPPYIPAQTNPYGNFGPGNVNSWDIDNNGIPDTIQQVEGNPLMNNSSSPTEEKGKPFDVSGLLNFVGGAINAGQGIKAAEDLTKHLETWANVSDVQKKAEISNAFVQEQPNEYYRGDALKNIFAANERGNTKGRGTDVFNVQNGSMIGGNPTEIQNMYSNEMTLYDDLGYEPLYETDDDNVKAFQIGGSFGNMLGGGAKPFLGGSALGEGGLFGGDTSGGSWLAGAMGGNSSYANAASMIPGPVGMFATMAAQMFDPNPGKQRNALNKINSNRAYGDRLAAAGNIHRQFSAVTQNGGDFPMYEEGGYMNPEYNPQVITMFGDHNAADFADYAHKYRAGGHLKEYTPPSDRAMETYAMGGKIQSHWGGKVEDESYNPYMPGSGISSVIKGDSHKDGGVGISYGGKSQNGYEYAANGANMGAQIEAEGGESMMEMEEGGMINPQTGEQDTNAVVIGNIPAKHEVLSRISNNKDLLEYVKKKGNDGRTMKSLFADLTKQEVKATKAKETASKIANNADKSKWGKLDLQTAQTIENAGDTSLEQIANTKIGFAESQDLLHKIKGQISKSLGYNISAEDLGRGKIKKDRDPITKDAPIDDVAKSGAYLRKAQNNGTINPADYETNFIKNFHDAIGMDPKTPGYGKLIGKKSAELYNNWLKTNAPDSYMSPQDLQQKGADIRDVFYGKEKSPEKSAELLTKSFLKYPGEGGKKFLKEFNLTPEGYKYIGKDKQAATEPTALDEVVIKAIPKSQQQAVPSATSQDPILTEAEYNELVKLYNEGASTSSGKSDAIKTFQKKYHQKFPKEALAAIQKTTAEKGLSNKARDMGLTKEDILAGKDIQKILESNEDEYWGDRTKQYMASINSAFNKRAPLQLNTFNIPDVTAKQTTTDKKGIDVVPLKKNNVLNALGLISQFFQNKSFPAMDQRQFAKEYVALAQNTPRPVPMQKPYVELDPIYRMNYNDVRNANTAAFRDMLRQNQGNPAADALAFGKFAQQNQSIGGEEFRTNQAIEQSIYGGNRAKMNANLEKGLQLNANQANLQSIADSNTRKTTLEAIGSMSDKAMKYTADKNKFLTASNLFPTYGYGANYQTHVQGPGYNPSIPQIYGGKATIQQVPVYKDGKLDHYEMIEGDGAKDNTLAPYQTPPFVADIVNKKNGGKVKKNYKNSSVVRAYKNL